MGDQLMPLPLTARSVHLYVDAADFSAEGTWPMPSMDTVLSIAAALANRHTAALSGTPPAVANDCF